MKLKFNYLLFAMSLFSIVNNNAQKIPIEYLKMQLQPNTSIYSKTILAKEIQGIQVEQVSITGDAIFEDLDAKKRYIYLFIKGTGKVKSTSNKYNIVPETILLPNTTKHISIIASKKDTLQHLKITSSLTEQDLLDLKEFPKENTENIYYKKFTDCASYTEPIKSPNTVSRTILPNKYIPRIAMGTVKTKGPDKVGAHEHAMLEQLFLGLGKNEVTVYADSENIEFPEYSILHIPLGSSHSVSVDKGKQMYYVWMDFFRDKEGEEWLKTHNTTKEN